LLIPSAALSLKSPLLTQVLALGPQPPLPLKLLEFLLERTLSHLVERALLAQPLGPDLLIELELLAPHRAVLFVVHGARRAMERATNVECSQLRRNERETDDNRSFAHGFHGRPPPSNTPQAARRG
jgi:hypothetical protein